ncbi:high mobility group protein 1 homolog [Antedon mediterranea]|uniref:high mobility group protein 1 homolog n=1 Tax=Antedon mediterranea TaxID=105859 RepID=UPI003AF45812
MGKKAGKPKGAMSGYAFFVKKCREELKEHVEFAQFSKSCAAQWKALEDPEKEPFMNLAKHDKERHRREMKDYIPENPTVGKGRKRRKKDPNAPKRNLSAFFLFSQDERAGVREIHPDWNVASVAKELAIKWRSITPARKASYDKDAQRDKERYLKAMEAYKKSLKSPQAQQKVQPQQKAAPKGAKKQKKDDSESGSEDEEESTSSDEASSSEESDE